jgi:hypothetical protein
MAIRGEVQNLLKTRSWQLLLAIAHICSQITGCLFLSKFGCGLKTSWRCCYIIIIGIEVPQAMFSSSLSGAQILMLILIRL